MFETFRLLRKSLRKSLKLRRLSKILGRELDYKTFLKELKDNERTDALEDLLDLCESDNAVREIMKAYGTSRETLRDLYWQLMLGGAGQWQRGHFVAASALVFDQTLSYCLEAMSRGVNISHIAFRCVEYFRRREVGMIQHDNAEERELNDGATL